MQSAYKGTKPKIIIVVMAQKMHNRILTINKSLAKAEGSIHTKQKCGPFHKIHG